MGMHFNPNSPAFALPAGLTPGLYMRTCREAAGLTPQQCAEKIALHHPARLRAARDIAALEADTPGDWRQLVDALVRHEAFAFSYATFTQLAAATCDVSLDEWAEI